MDSLSEEEQNKYLKHLENLHYKASMEWTLKIEAEDKVEKRGIKKGIEQGIEQGIVKIAKNLKNNNVDIETIMKSTGLTKKEIEKL